MQDKQNHCCCGVWTRGICEAYRGPAADGRGKMTTSSAACQTVAVPGKCQLLLRRARRWRFRENVSFFSGVPDGGDCGEMSASSPACQTVAVAGKCQLLLRHARRWRLRENVSFFCSVPDGGDCGQRAGRRNRECLQVLSRKQGAVAMRHRDH